MGTESVCCRGCGSLAMTGQRRKGGMAECSEGRAGASGWCGSRYDQRYNCGIVRERGNMLITTAGVGTSPLPFRLLTQPEIWVIDVAKSEKPLNQPVER